MPLPSISKWKNASYNYFHGFKISQLKLILVYFVVYFLYLDFWLYSYILFFLIKTIILDQYCGQT